MSRHNYTNPAFCQQSEFFESPSVAAKQIHTTTIANKLKTNNVLVRMQRSESMRSSARRVRNLQMKQTTVNCKQPASSSASASLMMHLQQRELPPKPGPKPSMQGRPNDINEGYALVPLTELPRTSKGRYAVVPANEAKLIRSTSSIRLTRSRDHLDLIDPAATAEYPFEDENSFTSLPAFLPQDHDDESPAAQQLASAFSSDFISDSMILVNPNGIQRYAIVPTDDDEEVVDNNHEIIQMHNGRAHRYAIIPTDDEEMSPKDELEVKTCVRNPYGSVRDVTKPFAASTAQKKAVDYARHPMPPSAVAAATQQPNGQQYKTTRPPDTPPKNPIATQKLHELLSTPRKPVQMQRVGSYHTIIQKSPEHRYRSQIICSTPKQSEFTPQKLHYEINRQLEQQRTTAVISPRLHHQQQAIYNETTSSSEFDKMHETFYKIEKATATIGIISLMLLLGGIMNSGLCLYMVTNVSSAIARR